MAKIRQLTVLFACIFVVVVAGCSDDAANDDGWHVGEDAAVDSGGDTPDAAGDADVVDMPDTDADAVDISDADAGVVDFDITFELENQSGRTVYAYGSIYGAGLCDSDRGYWLRLEHQGQSVRTITGCGPCRCGEDCGVCDCMPPPTASQATLEDGEARTYGWGGQVWVMTDQGCQEPEYRVGETFQAEFCWGTSFDDQGREITDVHCHTVDVELDPQRPNQVIRVLVPPPDPEPITFRMVNGTDGDLFADYGMADNDYACGNSWYTVGDGQETFRLYERCELCDCSVFEQSPDEACARGCTGGGACRPPERQMYLLEPGQERSHQWDGTIWVDDEVAGNACQRQLAPPADDLEATFCWGEQLADPDNHPYIDDHDCVDVSFDRLTDDEVVFRIE